ncbi:hypothetical protein E2562_037408 [Oryza meyeriana var. granulata]|uniref:Uncharacterized protein n=1 Tax=Oryza meyeriana var. granulata TaxID=110450 RepID=A0A6G1EDH8_9ORYZ|nr:hypothetical protein E2562_037408 [Oryza meyeriana var. granulata]
MACIMYHNLIHQPTVMLIWKEAGCTFMLTWKLKLIAGSHADMEGGRLHIHADVEAQANSWQKICGSGVLTY